MNADPWQREFDVAFRAVRDGALLARDIRQHVGAGALAKADHSPVTVADFAVQALVARRLAETFPDVPLVAEEDAAALRAPAGQTMLESVLAALRAAGLTVLFISHELSVVYRYATDVLCLSRDRVCVGPPRRVLTPDLLHEMYGTPVDYHFHDQ